MEGYIEVPGGRLFVRDEGAGPPVVLLHAAVVDQRSWDDVVLHLTAAGYRAVRYDARAFGYSSTEDVAFSRRADLAAARDVARHGGTAR